MQTTELKLRMLEAASEVLESMCFLSVLGESTESHDVDDRWIGSRLNFTGEDSSGSFSVCVPSGTAELIAENFLGQSAEEISRAQVDEVLCELANMICGSFLSRFRKDAIFDLTHPVCGAAMMQGSGNGASQTLALDEGLLHLWLEFTP